MKNALTNNDIKVIQKNDPSFPSYLDFESLRKEGIRHLGELSGKIWTDHNIHDPGIAILEMLCYALIDLGYRTQLPIKDLLAVDKKRLQLEDNFFSAAEILTNNPLTILDYRKLLIDTPGVRNAWLEVDHQQAVFLQISDDDNQQCALSCDQGDHELCLNGLYNVYLELEPTKPGCTIQRSEEEICEIVEKVKAKLHQYRNLGEDFLKIHVLCQEDIGFCGRIQLEDEADAESVILEIYLAIHEFLSPEVRFHTLKELLDKGKSIEEIYAGKPYFNELEKLKPFDAWYSQLLSEEPCLEQTFGFIDDEQLQDTALRKEIHLSDIQAIISCIDGVKSVEGLTLKASIEGVDHVAMSAHCGKWIHHLTPNHVPVFCPETTCFDFLSGGSGKIVVDQQKILRLFLEKAAPAVRASLEHKFDLPIPEGKFQPELGEYYSIQNEFPRNYGIGEGGLSPDASEKRVAQALQLKGYLLFYDQLLANYVGQISHLRDLFSILPDDERQEESRKTYFGGSLETVPQIDQLVRFYTDSLQTSKSWVENTVLALPIEDQSVNAPQVELEIRLFNSPGEREVAICQLQREFRQGEYNIEVLPDECGFIFIIGTSVESVSLHSKNTYKTYSEAQVAAKTVTFLATLEEAYRPVNNFQDQKFSFELVYKPVDYLGFLQSILEEPEDYCKRRNEFLDHLLARFSESFADYSMLVYGFNREENDLKQAQQLEIENKGRFLKNYPMISRNRGRAFNYKLDGWNTQNISGLERRVAGLSGIEEWTRKHLCNFEVHCYSDKFKYQLLDQNGEVVLTSLERFSSEQAASEALTALIQSLRESADFEGEDRENQEQYGIVIRYAGGAASYPEQFKDRESRDRRMQMLSSLFRAKPLDEQIYPAEYVHQLELHDIQGNAVKKSRKRYKSYEESKASIGEFARKINGQLWASPDMPRKSLELSSIDDQGRFLDITMFRDQDPVVSQYRWYLKGQDGGEWLESANYFHSREAATEDFVRFTELEPAGLKLEMDEQDGAHKIALRGPQDYKIAGQICKDETSLEELKIKLEQLIEVPELLGNWIQPQKNIYAWEVWAGDNTLLRSIELYDDQRKAKQSAVYAKSLIDTSDCWEVNQESDTSFKVTLKDKYRQLATSVAGLETKEQAKDLVVEISQAWNTEGHILTEGEQGFSYHIPQNDTDQDAVLSSYHCYRSRVEALSGIEDLMAFAKRKNSYFPSGDEANLNFSFLLRGKGKKFLAQHPFSYGSSTERDKALTATLNILKKISGPCDINKEYTFITKDFNNAPILRSAEVFTTQDKAKKAYLNMLPIACSEENYQKTTTSDGYTHKLRLCDKENQLVAEHPYGYVKWEQGDEIIRQVIEQLHPHLYLITSVEYPYKWRYKYDWEDHAGKWGTLMTSSDTHNSRDEAVTAYEQSLKRISRVKITEENTDEGIKLAFWNYGAPEPFAFSPSNHNSANGGEIKKEASSYLKRIGEFQRILSLESTNLSNYIQQIPGKDGGNYVYRVVKKDQYLAYHPCQCGDEVQEETCDKLFGLAQAGYEFLEICLAGDIACIDVDQKWHFLIKDKTTDEIYFKSFQGYDTKEEAEKAFREQYINIIDKASDEDSYGSFDPTNYHAILTEETFTLDFGPCADTSRPLAVVAGPAMTKYSIEALAALACSYPIRVKKLDNSHYLEVINGRFHFLLRDKLTDEIYFKSYRGYEDEEEAKCAFQDYVEEILESACSRESYGPYDPTKVHKILNQELFDQDYSQVSEEPLAVVSTAAWAKFGLQKIIRLVCNCQGNINTELKDECLEDSDTNCYYFHLVGNNINNQNPECKLDWKSEHCWNSAKEARTQFKLFFQLIQHKENYYSFQDVAHCCCHRLVIREVLLESCGGFESVDLAWSGLDRLLEVICEPGAIHTYWDDILCCHGIKVVEPGYYEATHPICYYHPDQGTAVIKDLISKCGKTITTEDFLTITINQQDNEVNALYSFSIDDKQQSILWDGSRSYLKETYAETAAWQTVLLSEHEEFYGLTNKKHLGLFEKNSRFQQPAETDLIASHQMSVLSREDLIKRARNHPCRKVGDQYYYQLYCEDFEVLEVDESPQECNDGKITARRKLKKINGAVVWKSNKKFDRCEDAEKAFESFCALLESRDNYQVIELGDCEKYQVVLTNPDKVLACHPMCYTNQERLTDAVERTKACTDTEGMHLVEHILLRPTDENCECFLPTLPDLDCPLPFELAPDDPCATRVNNHAVDGENPCEVLIPGADPYSFWATIVLPCWTKRFRRADFREIFQNLLRQEAPAHMGLNIVWVDPRQMCKFEDQYRDWLRYLSCKERCDDNNPYCDFIRCLSSLHNCTPNLPPEQEACDCNPNQPVNRTSFYINYAFTAEREAVYGQEFLNTLGVSGGLNFSLLGNVIGLTKSKFTPLFPKLPQVISDPDFGPLNGNIGEILENLEEPETTAEIERNIRRRLAAYTENVENIGDARFKRSESHARTQLFLSSTGEPEGYQQLMEVLMGAKNRARSQNSKKQHLNLMQQTTGYFLDQQVLREPHKISTQVHKVLKHVAQLLGRESSNVIKTWEGEQWKTWYKAKVVGKYQKIFK